MSIQPVVWSLIFQRNVLLFYLKIMNKLLWKISTKICINVDFFLEKNLGVDSLVFMVRVYIRFPSLWQITWESQFNRTKTYFHWRFWCTVPWPHCFEPVVAQDIKAEYKAVKVAQLIEDMKQRERGRTGVSISPPEHARMT